MYAVNLARRAQKDLDKLQGPIFERVVAALMALGDKPHPHGSKTLMGQEGGYRVRVGDYRILCDVDESARSVLVLRVKHRREAYREG